MTGTLERIRSASPPARRRYLRLPRLHARPLLVDPFGVLLVRVVTVRGEQGETSIDALQGVWIALSR